MSATVAEVLDEEDKEEESEEGVAAVADQVLDDEVAVPESTAVDESVVSVLLWVASAEVTVGAALSAVWTAITPPSPSSAATLPDATALRARRAGCGRLRRGVASGITRSFIRGPSHRPGRR